MCIKKSVTELMSGRAMYPDVVDIAYPLGKRFANGKLLIIYAYLSGYRMQILVCRGGEHNVVRDEWVGMLELQDMRDKMLMLNADEGVLHVLWVENRGWEVQPSQLRWQRSMRELQQELGKSHPYPSHEVESGRLYNPVIVSLTGEVWLFSVADQQVKDAVELVRSVGMELIRVSIGMAAMLRYVIARDSLQSAPGRSCQWLLEMDDCALLCQNKNQKYALLGQWSNLSRDLNYEVVSAQIEERITGADGRLCLYTEKGNSGLTQSLAVLEGMNVECESVRLHEVLLWDPEGDVQPDLLPEVYKPRPCLPSYWRPLRWFGYMAWPLILGWWGWQYVHAKRVHEEMIFREEQVQRLKGQIQQANRDYEAMIKEKSKVEVVEGWAKTLVDLPGIAIGALRLVPESLGIKEVKWILFEGQRQMEMTMDLVDQSQEAEPYLLQLMEFLQSAGMQVVSFEQTDNHQQRRVKGLFVQPDKI